MFYQLHDILIIVLCLYGSFHYAWLEIWSQYINGDPHHTSRFKRKILKICWKEWSRRTCCFVSTAYFACLDWIMFWDDDVKTIDVDVGSPVASACYPEQCLENYCDNETQCMGFMPSQAMYGSISFIGLLARAIAGYKLTGQLPYHHYMTWQKYLASQVEKYFTQVQSQCSNVWTTQDTFHNT